VKRETILGREEVECDEDCPSCSGEFCETHGIEPCDCDTAERHEAARMDAGAPESPEEPQDPDQGTRNGVQGLRGATTGQDEATEGDRLIAGPSWRM